MTDTGNASGVDRLCRWIVDHPRVVIGAVGVVTLVLGAFLPRARIDSSVATLIDPTDPEVRYYEELRQTFGNEEIDVVAVVADDVFAPATLAKIKGLSERLLEIPGVANVASLATVSNLGATADGTVDTSPLMAEIPRDAQATSRLKRAVTENPLFANTLVSGDAKMAALAIKYEEMSDAEFIASGAQRGVARLLEEMEGPERFYVTGSPSLKVMAAHLMRRDLLTFTPGAVVVIMAVLLLWFRTLRGVLLPVAATGLGLLWTIGLMGYFDVPIDFGTLVLPTLLTVVGSAYATHVVARHREEIDAGGTPGDIAYRVIRHLGTPVLVTALTTVLGFASLIVYRIEAIQHLGVFSVFGISALFVLALTFVPAVLTLLRVPQTGTGREPESAWLTGGLERLGRFDMRHRKTVIAASAIVLVFFTWGIRYMRVDTNYARYFSEDSPVREASRVIADHLGGSVAFLVAVDGPEPDSITRLDTLRRIAALEDFIDRLPGIDHTTSVVDYVKTLHRAFHDDDPAYFGLPDTDAGVQQYLLLLDPETIEDVVNADSSRATIVVRSRLVGSTALREAITSIRRFAADVFPEGYPVHTTGNVVLLNRTADDLSRGQVQSFVIALAVVFAILSLVFLSVRFGLVAMVPNLIPIVIFFGLLGWLNIPLSISTAVIASISLGIGVDEAVHLLAEFNHHVRKAADQEEAVLGALRSVGPPIVYATTALVLGFLVPAWSNFAPVRQFGLLSAVTVATSLLADLLLLPALLATARFVTLWDVLTVKLGRAPHETIPLFNGLRASQARIAALMGRLRTVGPAERIVARGEPGDEMYVLIRGSAQVLAGADGQEIALRTVTRGDVVGEMGLLRGQPRTAEVRALEETDLLVVNERFLQVLRRRYPRIATTVFFNLIRIVSDRLQETTEQLVARRTAAADASGKDAARRAGAGP